MGRHEGRQNAIPRRAVRPRPWRLVLPISGGNVGVWEHPYHHRHEHVRPYWVASAIDPSDRPAGDVGFDSLPEAVASAALVEAKLRDPNVRHLTQQAIRPVLWETQHTQPYINAPVEVQRAIIVALTQSNPSRASFARLLNRTTPGGFDRD